MMMKMIRKTSWERLLPCYVMVMVMLLVFESAFVLPACVYNGVGPDSNGALTIPDDWVEIPTGSYLGCLSIRTVVVGTGLTRINGSVFSNNKNLREVNFSMPSSLEYIGDSAFEETTLEEIQLPDSVRLIGRHAFRYCRVLRSVVFGKYLDVLGRESFRYGDALTSVTFHPETTINTLFESTFRSCGLQRFTIPESVTVIKKGVFKHNGALKSIVIPDSVTIIGESAFSSNSMLTDVTIGTSVTEIAHYAFSECSLESIVIPPNVKKLGRASLAINPNLKKVIIQSKQIELDIAVFGQCPKLTASSIFYPKGLNRLAWSKVDENSIDSILVECANEGMPCGCMKGCGNNAGEPYSSDYFTCAKCLSGHHSPEDRTTYTPCTSCESGKYQPLLGMDQCDDCPPGNSCEDLANTKFIECAIGRYQDSKGQDVCLNCPVGRYQNETGMARCEGCDVGTQGPFEGCTSKSNACFSCMPGHYAGKPGSSQCSECGKDTYSDSMGATQCEPCEEGKSTAGTGATVCSETSCKSGQGRVAGSSVCIKCTPGFASPLGETCVPCKAGTYANMPGSAVCKGCPLGRYGTGTRLTNESNCTLCEIGKYVNIEGAIECFNCPPGSRCPLDGMNTPDLCPAGTYTDTSNQFDCKPCPTGTYQNIPGSAKCISCILGKHNPELRAVDISSCLLCPVGSYASQNGTSDCSSCAVGQFQPLSGQSECHVCSTFYDDATLTNDATHTACIKNALLENTDVPSIIEVMFTKGVALYGTSIIAGTFTLIAGALQFHRSKCPHELAQLTHFQVVLKSFLPGFSFGSELFMIIGTWREAPGVAATLLLFRLLHVFGGVALLFATFGSEDTANLIEIVLAKAPLLNEDLDHDFSRGKIPFIGAITLVTMCDVTMCQFLPWKKSTFYTESIGFPNMNTMKFALGIKSVQAFVSVVCQLSYLVATSNINEPTSSNQAKILFSFNIVFSVLSVVLSAVLFVLKNKLLSSVQNDHDAVLQRQNKGNTTRSSQLELHDLYGRQEVPSGSDGCGVVVGSALHHFTTTDAVSATANNVSGPTTTNTSQNPMHVDEIYALRKLAKDLTSENSVLKARIAELTKGVGGTEQANTDMALE